MKKKSGKRQSRRNLSRLLSKLDLEFYKHDNEFLIYANFAELNHGREFITPYMERYYATWRKNRT